MNKLIYIYISGAMMEYFCNSSERNIFLPQEIPVFMCGFWTQITSTYI
jgi:hypothetical protein